MPIIEVSHLAKRYTHAKGRAQDFVTLRDTLARRRQPPSTFWALQDINFTLEPGEVLGVIGPNGAGKSTLFKIISRITRPTAGSVTLRGRVSSLLEVGTGFHPELSGRENIYLNGAILGLSRRDIAAHFDDIVEFSEIGAFLDDPVKFYSSGMYMRLGFSIAAFLTSEIMIIDEVLSVGDAAFRRKSLDKVQELVTQEGRTVLIVSHQAENVARLTQRCLWLDHGRMQQFGPTASVLAAYQHSLEAKSPKLPTDRSSKK